MRKPSEPGCVWCGHSLAIPSGISVDVTILPISIRFADMGDPFAKERPIDLAQPPHAPQLRERFAEISSKIEAVNWGAFQTAYGDAIPVAQDLMLLLFGSLAQAMDATHRLWSSLCHQHAYVSSAAGPALDFVLIALVEAPPLLKAEILDIILGLLRGRLVDEPFSVIIVRRILAIEPFFADLRSDSTKLVAEFASEICDEIGIVKGQNI